MTLSLSNLDFALIAIYFVIVVSIGYFSSRHQTSKDFLIAERRLGTLQTMATVNASKTGAVVMFFVTMVYMWGFSAIWYFVGATLGIILFIPFSLRLKQSSNQRFYTLADYFKYNYGKKSATAASLMTIFLMFGMSTLSLLAATKIFVFFSGWPFYVCAIIVMLIVSIYLLLGGFKAVVKTDIIQYIAMLFILFILAVLIFDTSLISTSDWSPFQAGPGTIAGFFLMGILFPFSMPELWQRVYSAKDKKTLKNGFLMSAGVYFFFALFLGLVALGIKARFPGIDPDTALIYGFKELLPTGLLGLSVVMLFSAIMSSLDTYIFTGASAIVQDFSKENGTKTVQNIRKTVVILTVLATATAILVQNIVIGSYIFVSFAIVLSIISFSTWIKKNIKDTTLLTGFIFGVIGVIVFLITSLIQGEITPTIIIAGLGASIFGLIIGSLFRKVQNVCAHYRRGLTKNQ